MFRAAQLTLTPKITCAKYLSNIRTTELSQSCQKVPKSVFQRKFVLTDSSESNINLGEQFLLFVFLDKLYLSKIGHKCCCQSSV